MDFTQGEILVVKLRLIALRTWLRARCSRASVCDQQTL